MVGGGFATTLGGIYGAVSLVDKSRFLGAVGTGVALLGVASMITAAVVGLPGDRSTPSLSENGKYELAKAATTANVSYAAAHATLDQVYQLDRAGKNQLSFNGAFDLSKAAVLGHVSASDAIDTLNQVNQLDHAGKDQLSAIGVIDLSQSRGTGSRQREHRDRHLVPGRGPQRCAPPEPQLPRRVRYDHQCCPGTHNRRGCRQRL